MPYMPVYMLRSDTSLLKLQLADNSSMPQCIACSRSPRNVLRTFP